MLTRYALLYGPYMLVGISARDEHTLLATRDEVERWVHVSRCAPHEAGDASASVLELELTARGANGGHFTLRPLSAVVEERYSAYFTLKSPMVPSTAG